MGWAIKVSFIPEMATPYAKPLEYIVKTEHYGIAHKTAKKRLILKGIDPSQYKSVVMAEILILEAEDDG